MLDASSSTTTAAVAAIERCRDGFFPLVLDGLEGFLRLIARRTPSVQARAEAHEHFDHVLNQIVRDFGFFHDDELPSLRGKRGLNLRGAETHQPVAVFHYHRPHLGIRQTPDQLGAMAIPSGTDFRHGLNNRAAMAVSIAGQAAQLCFQILPLVGRGYSSTVHPRGGCPHFLHNDGPCRKLFCGLFITLDALLHSSVCEVLICALWFCGLARFFFWG